MAGPNDPRDDRVGAPASNVHVGPEREKSTNWLLWAIVAIVIIALIIWLAS